MLRVDLNYKKNIHGTIFENLAEIKPEEKFNVLVLELWSKELCATGIPQNTIRTLRVVSGDNTFYFKPKDLLNGGVGMPHEWENFMSALNDINNIGDSNDKLYPPDTSTGNIIDLVYKFNSVINGGKSTLVRYRNLPSHLTKTQNGKYNGIYVNPVSEDFFRNNDGIVDNINSLASLKGVNISNWKSQQAEFNIENPTSTYTNDDKFLFILPIKEEDNIIKAECNTINNIGIDLTSHIDISLCDIVVVPDEVGGDDNATQIVGPLISGGGDTSNHIGVGTGLEILYREVEGGIVLTGYTSTSLVKVCTNEEGVVITTQKTEVQRKPIYNGCENPPPPSGCANCKLVGWKTISIPVNGPGSVMRRVRIPIWRDYTAMTERENI